MYWRVFEETVMLAGRSISNHTIIVTAHVLRQRWSCRWKHWMQECVQLKYLVCFGWKDPPIPTWQEQQQKTNQRVYVSDFLCIPADTCVTNFVYFCPEYIYLFSMSETEVIYRACKLIIHGFFASHSKSSLKRAAALRLLRIDIKCVFVQNVF